MVCCIIHTQSVFANSPHIQRPARRAGKWIKLTNISELFRALARYALNIYDGRCQHTPFSPLSNKHLRFIPQFISYGTKKKKKMGRSERATLFSFFGRKIETIRYVCRRVTTSRRYRLYGVIPPR